MSSSSSSSVASSSGWRLSTFSGYGIPISGSGFGSMMPYASSGTAEVVEGNTLVPGVGGNKEPTADKGVPWLIIRVVLECQNRLGEKIPLLAG